MCLTVFSYIILTIIASNFILIIDCDDEVYHWDADKYPNLTSTKEAKFCTGSIRNPPSSVCDPDHILTKSEAKIIDKLIDDINNDTKCFCESCPPQRAGLNIKVALLKFLKIVGNVSFDRTVEMFGERTRRRWHYGDSCSNDVLIVFVALEDKIYISMGSKAQMVLTEEDVKRVLEETKVHFTSGYYFQGLESIIASFQDLAQQYDPNKPSKLGLGSVLLIVISVSIVLITILLIIVWFFIRRRRSSLSNSFEFIGSWGRNRAKQKTQTKPKLDPIYKPVKTSDTVTLPLKTRDPIA